MALNISKIELMDTERCRSVELEHSHQKICDAFRYLIVTFFSDGRSGNTYF